MAPPRMVLIQPSYLIQSSDMHAAPLQEQDRLTIMDRESCFRV